MKFSIFMVTAFTLAAFTAGCQTTRIEMKDINSSDAEISLSDPNFSNTSRHMHRAYRSSQLGDYMETAGFIGSNRRVEVLYVDVGPSRIMRGFSNSSNASSWTSNWKWLDNRNNSFEGEESLITPLGNIDVRYFRSNQDYCAAWIKYFGRSTMDDAGRSTREVSGYYCSSRPISNDIRIFFDGLRIKGMTPAEPSGRAKL